MTIMNTLHTTEKQWQQIVYDAARRLNWLAYHTYDSRRSTPGFPDLVIVRGDRLIFAELKTDSGHVSSHQSVWLDRLKASGRAEVYLWRPRDWDDVLEILR